MSETNSDRREANLRRIRALMAKTVENGCTEAEAAEAARKVDELLALYEIDLDALTVRGQEIAPNEVSADMVHSVWHAASGIGRFTDCRVWANTRTKKIVYFGFKVDTEIAEYLTLLFKRAIDRETGGYTLFNPAWDAATKGGKTEMVRSFGWGMAVRLADRLHDMKTKRDWSAKSSGHDLVQMKAPAIDEALAKLGMKFSSHRGVARAHNQAAYSAGQAAAAHVAINHGVAQRAASVGGRLM